MDSSEAQLRPVVLPGSEPRGPGLLMAAQLLGSQAGHTCAPQLLNMISLYHVPAAPGQPLSLPFHVALGPGSFSLFPRSLRVGGGCSPLPVTLEHRGILKRTGRVGMGTQVDTASLGELCGGMRSGKSTGTPEGGFRGPWLLDVSRISWC